uniref:Cytochrome c biogenesis protein CcsA n=1 Tax=Taxillus rhododendricola TaxID=2805425 RepID=A0A8K1M649_9MAGN|nr:cytochrome c heme attachment protein [Taxillus pseudochinensis]YP_010212824.1 cytochrome c heme attachment protein [Taxillus tsaii]YP_010212891.1 cytochrome c heme attachment protein [Taxillus rhododendricola]UBK10681.1 cytochrome c heme attachment protein [Taxillus pseudochinensis]UBK10882.1 cytochrome c heme attachment protein [Taxillus pseudochinensis]UBK10949.1 cytochrome c heme attachment protein [Taxillus tsaii]UBK11016.1 cytochrome c heme attachment protein [Taxillus rhododendricola
MLFSTFEHILTHISFSIVSILIPIVFRIFLVNEIIELSDSSERGITAGFCCLTGLLINRWIRFRHFPLSELSESLIFLSWGFSIIYLVLYLKIKNKNLSSIIKIGVIFTQVFATSNIFNQIHKSVILVPALQSQWLMMHVSMTLVGYASLLCGSLLSVTLLVITFQKNRIIFSKIHFLLTTTFYFVNNQNANEKIKNVLQSTSFFSTRNFYRYQLIQQLEHWSYRVISIGFFFFSIGILSGAVWANEAWGSYWNWDPKETWAFITWIIFTIYLHTKKTANGTNSSIVAVIGFLLIWLCYFGINLLEIGLHSYGSFRF